MIDRKMKKFIVILMMTCLVFSVFAAGKLKKAEDNDGKYQYNAIKVEVAPYSLNIVDFYNADYRPEHYGEKKTFISNYALNANFTYQRRFSKGFELEAGAGYALSMYKHIVTPDAVNFHYISALVGGKYVLPFKNRENLEFTVGGFGGVLVGFNAGLTSVAPEVAVKLGIRYFVKPQFAIGVEAGAGMSFWIIPDEEIRNSFTFRINPVNLTFTYKLDKNNEKGETK